MLPSALFASLHFFFLFGIVGTLFYEWLAYDQVLTWVQARRIQLCDRWYGIFAAAITVIGMLRVYYFEKGKAYYFANPFYRGKMWLFIIVGALSIYPTIHFMRWRPQTRQGLPPVITERDHKLVRRLLLAEMVALAGMALCASMMARGIGM